MSFEGKILRGQYIDYSEKKMAQGLHLPLYWDYFLYHSYIQQISGERLQDHWSSCFCSFLFSFFFSFITLIVLPVLLKMACQSKDLESLRAIQVELWPLFSEEQNQLLHLVITELSHPSGEGL